jgi:hypothetical protein
MSYHHLQRVVVRMLFDPTLVAQIFADPATALGHEDLTEQEKRWLVEVDRRAYAVDPLRRTRTLTALIEEFPVSVHHLVQQTGQAALLDTFFSSTYFHTCIQQRGSLAVAFSEYVLAAAPYRSSPGLALAPLVEIEMAMAHLRRQPSRLNATPPSTCHLLRLAPTVALMPTPLGTLAHYQATLETLRSDPDGLVAAALKPSILPDPQETQDHEWLLIVWHQDSAAIELLPEALGPLLAATPASRSTLVAAICALGADVHEANEILDDLVTGGVLCAGGADAELSSHTRSTHD